MALYDQIKICFGHILPGDCTTLYYVSTVKILFVFWILLIFLKQASWLNFNIVHPMGRKYLSYCAPRMDPISTIHFSIYSVLATRRSGDGKDEYLQTLLLRSLLSIREGVDIYQNAVI